MKELSPQELIIINGGAIEKERSSLDSVITVLSGAIAGVGGLIISLFN